MSRGHETITARFEFFDKLRLYLLQNSPVSAKQIADEFNITDRQAREYMYALNCQQHGSQNQRTYTYSPEQHLLDLVNVINIAS